jgi:hypothetical protein
MNESPSRDLDTLIEAARITAKSGTAAQQSAVLHTLAQSEGGLLTLDALLASGAPRDVVASLVDEESSNDKRRKCRARLGIISGTAVVWLTSTGWQAVGRPSGREVNPSSDSVAHAAAPSQLASWLAERSETLAAYGITARVTYGSSVRRFSDEIVARAWARLRSYPDPEGAVGSLTGGLLPDGLLIESWRGPNAAETYRAAWGLHDEAHEDDLAETTTLIEVEDSRKSSEPLRSKVDRLTAVTDTLQAARAVVWIVRTREVADRLRDLGVDDPSRRPNHLLVDARVVGLGGEDIGSIRKTWWPIALDRAGHKSDS